MHFSDVVTLNAAPTTVWLLLEDARSLAPCVPGLQQFEPLDSSNGFRGTVSLPFGSTGVRFPAQVEWVEQREPHQGKLRAVARLASQEIRGTGLFELAVAGENVTRLSWSATVEVPDELGENRFLTQLVRSFALRFVQGFFACVQEQIASQL